MRNSAKKYSLVILFALLLASPLALGDIENEHGIAYTNYGNIGAGNGWEDSGGFIISFKNNTELKGFVIDIGGSNDATNYDIYDMTNATEIATGALGGGGITSGLNIGVVADHHYYFAFWKNGGSWNQAYNTGASWSFPIDDTTIIWQKGAYASSGTITNVTNTGYALVSVNTTAPAPPIVSTPYAHLSLKDLYDNTTLPDGTTCYMGEVTNTSVSGVCYFFNQTTGFNYTIPAQSIWMATSGTATPNATSIINLTRNKWVSYNITSAYYSIPIAGANITIGNISNTTNAAGIATLFNLGTETTATITHNNWNNVTDTFTENTTNTANMNSSFLLINYTNPNGETTANQLSMTCGATEANFTNITNQQTIHIIGGRNCNATVTYGGLYYEEFDDLGTAANKTTHNLDLSPRYNAYFTFTGALSGDSYNLTCYNASSTQLSHVGQPYYLIGPNADNYTCQDTLYTTELNMTLNNTRVLNQSFTVTEYKMTLTFSTSNTGSIYWGDTDSSGTLGGGFFNWTNTTLIKKITEFCPDSDYECKVTVKFDTDNTTYPQYYEFYNKLGQMITQHLYVIPNKNAFGVWQVISKGGNPIKDARLYQGIKVDGSGSAVISLNASNVRYTDSEGISTMYFNSEDYMSILITKDGYAATVYTYYANEVSNTTYNNPVIIELDEAETTGYLDTYLYCNIYEMTTEETISCYVTTPHASTITWYTDNGIKHTATIGDAQIATFTLTRCTAQAAYDAGECDYFNTTSFNVTIEDDTTNIIRSIMKKTYTTEQETLRNWLSGASNGGYSAVPFLNFPDVAEGLRNGLLFIMLIFISILIGVYANLPTGDAGFHTFQAGMIVISAITGTFLVATTFCVIYYIARGFHLTGEQ